MCCVWTDLIWVHWQKHKLWYAVWGLEVVPTFKSFPCINFQFKIRFWKVFFISKDTAKIMYIYISNICPSSESMPDKICLCIEPCLSKCLHIIQCHAAAPLLPWRTCSTSGMQVSVICSRQIIPRSMKSGPHRKPLISSVWLQLTLLMHPSSYFKRNTDSTSVWPTKTLTGRHMAHTVIISSLRKQLFTYMIWNLNTERTNEKNSQSVTYN